MCGWTDDAFCCVLWKSLKCFFLFALLCGSEEMTQAEFNSVRGITSGPRVDHGLYSFPAPGKTVPAPAPAASQEVPASQDNATAAAKKPRSNEAMYYRITCKVHVPGVVGGGAIL
jgi:hypothetical protein